MDPNSMGDLVVSRLIESYWQVMRTRPDGANVVPKQSWIEQRMQRRFFSKTYDLPVVWPPPQIYIYVFTYACMIYIYIYIYIYICIYIHRFTYIYIPPPETACHGMSESASERERARELDRAAHAAPLLLRHLRPPCGQYLYLSISISLFLSFDLSIYIYIYI